MPKNKMNKRTKATMAEDGRNRSDFLQDHTIVNRRPLSALRMDKNGQSTRSLGGHKTNHVEPLDATGDSRGRHKRKSRGKGKQVTYVPAGQTPPPNNPKKGGKNGKNGGRQPKMMPWVPIPHRASAMDYVLVLREMLEGDNNRPELGFRQMELHDVFRILTSSPRCAGDYRHVIHVLRILLEDKLIDAAFVESVIAEHPILGNRRITKELDTDTIEGYVSSLKSNPKPQWKDEANKRYEETVIRMRDAHVQQIKEKYPSVSRNEVLNDWKEPQEVPFRINETQAVWVNKKDFVMRYVAKQAQKTGDKIPTLVRLHGLVTVPTISNKDDTKIYYRKEKVDVEIALKANGGLWIGLPYYKWQGKGKSKRRVSAFMKQFLNLPHLRKQPADIDGHTQHDSVRDRLMVRKPRTVGSDGKDEFDNATLKELSENKRVSFKIEPTNSSRKSRKRKRVGKKVEAKRGQPRSYTNPDKEE